MVATVPQVLRRLFYGEQKLCYGLLMKTVASAVCKLAWCSFRKSAGNGREAVLNHLSRHVFRIAITRNRLLTMDEPHVTFRHKDNDTGAWKIERIPGVEFIRRFLMHVLPRGFHKVRCYVLWSAPHLSRHHALRSELQRNQTELAPPTPILVSDVVKEALAGKLPKKSLQAVQQRASKTDQATRQLLPATRALRNRYAQGKNPSAQKSVPKSDRAKFFSRNLQYA